MNTTQRLTAALRREQILNAAILLSSSINYAQLTRRQIAETAGVAPTLVSHHFGTMVQLRRALMRYAVHGRHLTVIAQGLAARDAQAQKASPEVQAAALGTLL